MSLATVEKLYPHIYKKLMLLQGNQEALNTYIDSLILSERGSRMRIGFDPVAFDEVLELYTKDKTNSEQEFDNNVN